MGLRAEVLVQIHAAGVNQLDSKITNGEFKFILPYRLPFRWPSSSTPRSPPPDLLLAFHPAESGTLCTR
jgi:hypothetical protein